MFNCVLRNGQLELTFDEQIEKVKGKTPLPASGARERWRELKKTSF